VLKGVSNLASTNREREQIRVERLLGAPETREDGLRLLADSSIRTAASLAAKHLQDSDEFVRNAALECLKERGGRRYADHVAECLRDKAEVVRITAIECLVAWGVRSLWPRLVKLLSDRSPLVRAYSAWALGQCRSRGAKGALTRRLKIERNPTARAGILEALVMLTRDRYYLEALLRSLSHKDYSVRCFAANSLVGVTTRKTIKEVEGALRGALEQESTVAGREAIENSLASLSL
jgi:HEAT repeat protein